MQNGHGLTRPPGTGSLTTPAPLVPLRKRIHRLGHLAARYTDAVLSRRLTPAEQAEAAGYLRSDAERGMFWGQSRADRRHGLAAARSIAVARPDRPDLIRAALLHDVGKRHARLGAAGRVWAVVRSGLGFPPSERGAVYLDHGRRAAEELAAGGTEPLVVAYALHHHGRRPSEIASEDWKMLQEADRARLPGYGPDRRRRQRPRPDGPSTYDGARPADEAGK